MKKLLLALMLFAAPAFAAEQAVEKPTTAQSQPSALEAFILKKAEQYSGKIEDAVEKAVDLAQEEVPETVRQFLIWKAWSHGIKAVLFIWVLPLGLFVFFFHRSRAVWGFANESDYSDQQFNKHTGFTISGMILMAIGAPTFFNGAIPQIMSFVQIQVAPRIYIIEQVSQWLK